VCVTPNATIQLYYICFRRDCPRLRRRWYWGRGRTHDGLQAVVENRDAREVVAQLHAPLANLQQPSSAVTRCGDASNARGRQQLTSDSAPELPTPCASVPHTQEQGSKRRVPARRAPAQACCADASATRATPSHVATWRRNAAEHLRRCGDLLRVIAPTLAHPQPSARRRERDTKKSHTAASTQERAPQKHGRHECNASTARTALTASHAQARTVARAAASSLAEAPRPPSAAAAAGADAEAESEALPLLLLLSPPLLSSSAVGRGTAGDIAPETASVSCHSAVPLTGSTTSESARSTRGRRRGGGREVYRTPSRSSAAPSPASNSGSPLCVTLTTLEKPNCARPRSCADVGCDANAISSVTLTCAAPPHCSSHRRCGPTSRVTATTPCSTMATARAATHHRRLRRWRKVARRRAR
jgi:hypothetical protein